MRRFLLGAVVGVLFTIVFVVVLLAVIAKMASGRKPTIASNSVLVLNLEDDIPEVPAVDVEIPLFQNQAAPSVRDLWTAIHAAASDSRIKAIALKPHNLSIGWAKLQELREDLADFKRSG